MMRNRVVGCFLTATLLAVLPLAWATGTGAGTESASHSSAAAPGADVVRTVKPQSRGGIDLSMTERDRALGLEPRAPMPRRANAELRIPEHALSNRLIVKFKDGVQARASRVPTHQVQSLAATVDMSNFNAILEQFGLSARQAMSQPVERLRQLELEATNRTGRAQPDLAGIMFVEGPAGPLEEAARLINTLPIIEYVEFEADLEPKGLTEAGFREHMAELAAMVAEQNEAQVPKEEIAIDPGVRPSPPRRAQSKDVQLSIDSGVRTVGEAMDRAPQVGQFQRVFSEVVGEHGAPWVRVHFSNPQLSGSAARGTASYIKITSLDTGDSQVLDAAGLARWRHSSAYFNGGLVEVELFAWPNTGPNRIVIDSVTIGKWVGGGGAQANVCDDEDNRELVFDTEEGEACSGTACVTGRLFPTFCTGFVFRDDGDFQDNKHWLMTAGHCVAGGAPDVIQFNVPPAAEDGTPQHPLAADQFPLEPIVLFSNDQVMDPCSTSCHRDWAMLTIDSEEGNPVDTYNLDDDDVYHLVSSPPTAIGQDVLIRGYGNTMETPAPLEWNNALKDSIGPLITSEFTVNPFDNSSVYLMEYRADSTGGDSGAPVTLLGGDGQPTNELIAIHTCGGCQPVGGFNRGTSINLQDLVHARDAAFNEDVEDPMLFNSGACCIAGECFNNLTPDECDENNGTFSGFGTVCGPLGCSVQACCAGIGDDAALCEDLTEWECRAQCRTVLEFQLCDPDPENQPEPCDIEPACGEPTAGSCYTPNGSLGCASEALCEDVCEIDPDCCVEPGDGVFRAGGWDEVCAWHARRLFPTGNSVGPFATQHPCFETVGDCFADNSTIGCDDPGCCLSVCMLDPLCCEAPFEWDSVCADLANEICTSLDSSGPTPDFSTAQGYMTSTSYFEDFEDFTGIEDLNTLPPLIAAAMTPDIALPEDEDDETSPILEPVPSSATFTKPTGYPQFFSTLPGWSGEGFDLDGLWDFAESLNTGEVNMTRGLGTRIAVLYPTAFVQPTDGTPETDNDETHEDLRGRVLYPEVDQTQIIIPGSTAGFLNGHAGTAILGIIGANPDNDLGMKGMSPDAELYFFPTVSAEEGGRLFTALSNAIDMFSAGDVIVVPYTPRPVNSTFASTTTSNLLFALATDLGISTVAAAGDYAGNAAAPMAAQAGEIDSGVTIVGAVTPGEPFYRAGFSQFCTGTPCDPLAAVHTSAWGHAVATLGYGDLFMGETDGEPDVLRSYTNTFGGCGFNNPACGRVDTGTGAAAAQVAATIANIQGIPKMFFGIPMSPIQIRGEYAGNSACQGGFCLGSEGPLGTANDPSYYGDWSLDADPKVVGSISWPDPQTGTILNSIGVMWVFRRM